MPELIIDLKELLGRFSFSKRRTVSWKTKGKWGGPYGGSP